MQGSRIYLKTFLDLAMPNLCSQAVIIWGQSPLTFTISIYSTAVPYDYAI